VWIWRKEAREAESVARRRRARDGGVNCGEGVSFFVCESEGDLRLAQEPLANHV
jgi:hypothetical protein